MLENLKYKLIQVAKKAEKDGLCKHKSGNFSIRDEKTGYIVVTPSGISRDKLNVNNICVVDMNLNLIEADDNVKPTSELLMHIEAYKIRKDIKAIVHTHSKFATAFSVLNKEIPPIVYEIVNVVGGDGRIRVAPYGRPGTDKLAKSIIEPLKISDACLLQHHGVISISNIDIDDAFLKASYIEEISEVYYRTLLLNNGNEPELISEKELGLWKYPDKIKV